MTDDQQQNDSDIEDGAPADTSPPEGKTHEATTPPGQGDRDDDLVKESEDKLDQAGGGH